MCYLNVCDDCVLQLRRVCVAFVLRSCCVRVAFVLLLCCACDGLVSRLRLYVDFVLL